MSHITEQKCPNCGAPMRFDPASGLLVCDNCGNKVDVSGKPSGAAAATPPEESEFAGLDFDMLQEQAIDPDAADLPIYNCVSCGAEVIAPPEQVALTCPYCRNNIVLTNKVSGKLRPNGVIPFKIKSEDLPAAVRKYYRGKKLLPRGFFTEATMGKVTGVYVPFWVFTGKMAGRINYNATNSRSYRRGDYIITETDHYRLARDAALDFKDLPVDAGKKVDDRLMDSLEPFRMKEVRDFDMRYLAGFTADRFDQTSSDMAERAKKRMTNSAISLLSAECTAGYQGSSPTSHKMQADLEARYLLFPVYMFDINHGGKNYHFAVNGQTGRVVGDLPISKGTKVTYFLAHAGILSGALVALQVILYMLGF